MSRRQGAGIERCSPLVNVEVCVEIRGQTRGWRGASYRPEREVVAVLAFLHGWLLLHAHRPEVEAVRTICLITLIYRATHW